MPRDAPPRGWLPAAAAPCTMPSVEPMPPAEMIWLCHDLGSCSWDVDHTGWVAKLHSPEQHDFSGTTLEEALAWCLAWLMAPERGSGCSW